VPELPEVETIRRGLHHVTLDQEIQGGEVLLDRAIAHPACSEQFLFGLRGVAIADWHRRGKYLLAELISEVPDPSPSKQNVPSPTWQSAGWLGVHLRMTGQLLWCDRTDLLQKHTRVRLFFAGNKELRFVDQRTFGQMWWVPPHQTPEEIMTGLQTLGPEPFSEEFSIAYLVQQFQQRRRPVKNALLDQAIAAGIGNIYADEALFLSGIHPTTLCLNLDRKKIEHLHSTIRRVLQDSIDARGTTLRDFRDVDGINGNYGGVAWVYARDGEPCKICGTVIQRLKMAGRSAHYCPQCQQVSCINR
jgi:formamidopyrimidine-DNA glycosylase